MKIARWVIILAIVGLAIGGWLLSRGSQPSAAGAGPYSLEQAKEEAAAKNQLVWLYFYTPT
ncbi:MAG: hypothetical protein AB1331_10025 [Bacillota bacterium]